MVVSEYYLFFLKFIYTIVIDFTLCSDETEAKMQAESKERAIEQTQKAEEMNADIIENVPKIEELKNEVDSEDSSPKSTEKHGETSNEWESVYVVQSLENQKNGNDLVL